MELRKARASLAAGTEMPTSRRQSLRRAVAFVSECRQLSDYMPAQTLACLLVIARKPGITMQELAKKVRLKQSSCSRNVAVLSRWEQFGKPGLDLVESIDDPRERRRKIIYLTANGEQRVQSIVRKLDPTFELPKARLASA
ncbi:MarR family transcriptional regulator [Bradyrhizobium sp. ma5]|uniref:MarR family transcriptional regulator n=1 Tax=Bradyrhizobium sp. ma5 TaxID=3344828 RepID=UPI0035D49B45